MKQPTFEAQCRTIVKEVADALTSSDEAYGQITTHITQLLGTELDSAKTIYKGLRDSKAYKGASERVQNTLRTIANRYLQSIGKPKNPNKTKSGANTSGKAKDKQDKSGAALVMTRNNWRAKFWQILEMAKPVMPEEAYNEIGAILNKYAK